MAYQLGQYAGDMLALLGHLHQQSPLQTLDWVGTSMGGLIGMAVCGQPGLPLPVPVRRLVLNDVGPVIEWQALQRIGQYLGQPVRFESVQQAADMLWSLSTTFGPHTPEQWLELSRAMVRPPPEGGLGLHYDPAIAVPFRAIDAQAAAAGEAALWQLYDHIDARTLLLRGAQSDLLSPATAQAMRQAWAPGSAGGVCGGGPCPYAGCVRPGRCRGVVSSGPVRQERCMKNHSARPVAESPVAHGTAAVPELIAATAQTLPEQVDALARARNFAEPLIAGEHLDTGENALDHADAVAAILKTIGGSEAMQAATYLVHACIHLSKPQEVIAKAFGDNFATLAVETTQLMRVQQQARAAQTSGQMVDDPVVQTENVRKMLLAFSRDLRVVMLRLASRLQTLRYYAASKQPVSPGIAREALHVFAPLANRLGIWQIKWEMEDLAFRFLEPETYREIAGLLDEKRGEREVNMVQLRERVESQLRAQSISATVTGRPKHIYSIVKKMRGKSLNFDQVLDIRALRVIVPSVKDCYAALSWVHSEFTPVVEEFDDYIAKPKPNGYQSLHTIVRDDSGKATEIQIRTQAMHDHAEHGVAAHWAYKEAGAKGYAGVSASGEYDAKIAVLRQLLAWERDLSGAAATRRGLFEDRIYVLTPNDAAVVELPQGATPLDFAYPVHTNLGHRCRGARIDGVMVPLNTPLQNGQTVEIITVKEGRPSRDWLNPDLGYLTSDRARSKVRAWFNAQATARNRGAWARGGGKAAAARGQDCPEAG